MRIVKLKKMSTKKIIIKFRKLKKRKNYHLRKK
jgi:hypothetical protein